MKKLIFILIAGLIAMTSFAQIVNDSIVMVVVKDTTFINDSRLIYMTETIIPATIKFIDDYNLDVKVKGDSLTYKAATIKLIRGIQKEINDYANNFMVVKDIQIDSSAIVKEFNDLNIKIQALENDPDIKYIEAKSEFKRIQRRQQTLAKYYQQILVN